MPSKKNTSQKQKQKKAKQQQQQQQNIKISVRVGEKGKSRQPRRTAVKQPIVRQAPIIQQAPYIPMFLNQQPAQYFTPPMASTTSFPLPTPSGIGTIPITPPSAATAPITTATTTTVSPAPTIIPLPRTSVPSPRTSIPIPIPPPTRPSSSFPSTPTITRATTAPSIELDTFSDFGPRQNIISNFVGSLDIDEPKPFSFGDWSKFYSTVDEFNSYADYGTQTDMIPPPPPIFIRRAGTQTDETYVRRSGTQTEPMIGNEGGTQTEPMIGYEIETQTTPIRQSEVGTQTGRRYVSSTESQTTPTSLRDFGTQFEDFMPQVPDVIPTAMSTTLREMETQTEKIIPRPPPLPRMNVDFMSATQDIQPSGIQSIVNLTQENLSKFGGLSSVMPRGVSEISDLTEGTSRSINTEISDIIRQEALNKAGRQSSIEDTIKQQKEENKKRVEDSGMFGQMKREMDKRRQFIQPRRDEEDDDEWDDEPKQSARRKVGGKMERIQKEPDEQLKQAGERIQENENEIAEKKSDIEFWKDQIENMKKNGIERDMVGMTIEDYKESIDKNEEAIKFLEQEISGEEVFEGFTIEEPEEKNLTTREIVEGQIEDQIRQLQNRIDGDTKMMRNYNTKRIQLVNSGSEVDGDGYNVGDYDRMISEFKADLKANRQRKTRKENQLKKMREGSSKGELPIVEEEELDLTDFEQDFGDVETEFENVEFV